MEDGQDTRAIPTLPEGSIMADFWENGEDNELRVNSENQNASQVDWEPVVIRKKAPTSAARKDEKAVNAARRSGGEIETFRKDVDGTNRAASSSTTLNTRKLDEDTENLAQQFTRMKNKKKAAMIFNSKLKIAIIHPDLGIGGAERLIVDAAVQLSSSGHSVHVFTSHHDKNRCFEETVSGVFPVTVYGDFLPRHIFYHFHAVCAYIRCIFVVFCMLFFWPSFDVVLADQVSIVMPLLKLKKSTKVVFYCHFPDLLLAQHTTILRRIYRKPIDFLEEMTTGLADLILVNSKFTASTFAKTFKHLDARGIRPAVLYPAVNLDQFSKPNATKLNFLSINRFERKKNIALAISAFSMLHNTGNILDGSDTSLTIAGGFDKRLKENVEYLEELTHLADKEGVSNRIRFITSCPTAERNLLLSECLCVLYTPQDEHFGIVPLEAMAAHKPVIACNSGGPVETIKHGETGFLCDPNPRDFSLAMAKFVQDPQLAEKMGTDARQHVEESFSTEIFGQHLNRYVVDIARGKEE